MLFDTWTSLAAKLEHPLLEVRKMQQNLLVKTQSHRDILIDLLVYWRSRKSSEATMEKLCECFQSVEGMKAISDHLLDHFGTHSRSIIIKDTEISTEQVADQAAANTKTPAVTAPRYYFVY